MDVILFLIFALIAVVCAINVVVQTHPITSALSLIGVMGSLAILCLLLGAEFIAAAQVIVYAGAIMVLFVFVIMLLNAGAETKKGRSFMAQLLGGAVLFALGAAGFLFRRNIITVFMSIELMLNAVNLSFIAFSYQLHKVDGHLFTFFVMVVAAAEAAVGLAIILTVFKNRQTLNIDEVDSMKN